MGDEPQALNRQISSFQVKPVSRKGCLSLSGCLTTIVLLLTLGVILVAYALFPGRTNILVLGIDYAETGMLSRSDTIILTTFVPVAPYVGMLSIPRDLWVVLPGIGEDRINTAHFWAESVKIGSGPAATMQTIQHNFGVNADYYVRVQFDGFRQVIDAMGGVDIDLPEATAGYEAGRYHLTGKKALAFARQRYGSDDFARMENGQLVIKAVFTQMLKPGKWIRLPAVLMALSDAIDTNVPSWLWLRLGIALLRVGPSGLDNHTLTHEMATPFTTVTGADVLLPNWDLINPLVQQIFLP